MDKKAEHISTGLEAEDAEQEEAPYSISGDKEQEELYLELCRALKDVIPPDFFSVFESIRPIEAANHCLLMFGGRIRLHNPEIDLTGNYGIPEEVAELNDTISRFKFWIPPSPFIALVAAAKGEINADEEILQSRDRENMLPLVIEQKDEVKRICLIDIEKHILEITLELGLQLDVNLTGSDSDRKEATDKALKDLEHYLDVTKKKASDIPKLFDSPEEEAAVAAWCEKHSYTVTFAFRASIDFWL